MDPRPSIARGLRTILFLLERNDHHGSPADRFRNGWLYGALMPESGVLGRFDGEFHRGVEAGIAARLAAEVEAGVRSAPAGEV